EISDVVKCPLNAEELAHIRKEYELICSHKEPLAVLSAEELKIAITTCKVKLIQDAKNIEAKALLMAIIREQFRRSFIILPYNMQMLNVLALLNEPNDRRLAQIKTGEGKSAIIAILAAW